MTEKGERCQQHYQSVYERNQPELSKGCALDECLHHFLDQRPAGKNLSAVDRAQGLASASFWLDVDTVAQSELASLALILRDEKYLLRPMDELDEGARDSLFPDVFTAGRFIALVESDELWRGIC
jgi:hypothetical protein